MNISAQFFFWLLLLLLYFSSVFSRWRATRTMIFQFLLTHVYTKIQFIPFAWFVFCLCTQSHTCTYIYKNSSVYTRHCHWYYLHLSKRLYEWEKCLKANKYNKLDICSNTNESINSTFTTTYGSVLIRAQIQTWPICRQRSI